MVSLDNPRLKGQPLTWYRGVGGERKCRHHILSWFRARQWLSPSTEQIAHVHGADDSMIHTAQVAVIRAPRSDYGVARDIGTLDP